MSSDRLPDDGLIARPYDNHDNHGDHQTSSDEAAETVTPDVFSEGDNTPDLPEQLQRVYDSARWVPDSSTRIQYPTPQELIDPFLGEVATRGVPADFNAHTSRSRTVEENGSGTQHTAFGRVLVEAEFGDYNRHDTIKTVGLVYDLTIKNPIIKVYAGHNVRACTNLMIFNATHVFEGSLMSGGEKQAQGHMERYFDELPEYEDEFMHEVDQLKDTYLREPMLNELLGRMLRSVNASNTFGASTLNYAVKLMDDSNSRYALDSDGGCTAWNLLQALTQYVSDKKKNTSPHLVPSKSLEIGEEITGQFLDTSGSLN